MAGSWSGAKKGQDKPGTKKEGSRDLESHQRESGTKVKRLPLPPKWDDMSLKKG